MISLLLDLDPKTFWNAESGSFELILKCFLALLLGFGIFGLCFVAPTQLRRIVIFVATFVSGLFYILFYYFPTPIARQPGDAPRGAVEAFGFWLGDAVFSNECHSEMLQKSFRFSAKISRCFKMF